MSSCLKGCATRPEHHPLAPGTRPAGLIRMPAGGQVTQVASRPPKVAFWVLVGLTVVALAAVGGELVHARRSPDPAWADHAAEAEANAALVARFYAQVWNQGTLTLLDELVAADHAYHDPTTPRVAPGPAGIRRLVAEHRAAFPDATVTLDDVVAVGDRVAVRFTERATHRGRAMGATGTGRTMMVTGVAVFRVAHRQMAETWVSWDAYGLAQQLGLSLVPAGGPEGDEGSGSDPERPGTPR